MIAQSMEEKIAAINAKAKSKSEEATKLLEYLSIQRDKAKVTEDEEEEALKKKGIIIGQHIPSLKSKLDLDSGKLSEFDNFSSTLLVAKTLVDQNKTNFLRRTGNLPISDLAETRKAQNEKRNAEVVPDMPNYVFKTASTTVREERVGERFAETISSHTMAKTQRRELEMSASEGQKKLPKKKKHVLSAPERLANEDVLKSINHKLNYLRNPRNDPSGVTRMLVKPKAHFEQHADAADGGSVGRAAAEDSTMATSVDDHRSAAKAHSHHGASVEAKSVQSHGEGSAKKKYGKSEKITNNPLFLPEPSTLFFTNYDVGTKYTQTLSFRNISAVTRSFRVLPPKNPAFVISPLKFPANSNGGMVAPGMNVTTTVTFLPTTLGDFVDEIHVDTESGSFDVHVRAQREPPQLSIPSVLDVGSCLVGDAQRLSFNCLNSGGGGRFRLLSVAQHRAMGLSAADAEETASSILASFLDPSSSAAPACMRVPPFTLYPTEFALMKGDAVEITIEFVPLDLCAYQETFYMICDNGQVRTFTLRGASKQLDLTVTEINSVEFQASAPNVFPDMYFPAACVGSEQAQQLQVVNDTGLPVEYEWIWVDIKNTDLHAQGQRQIYDRERIEKMRHALMLENELNGVEQLPGGELEHLGGGRGHTAADAAVKRDLLKSLHVSMEGAGDRGTTADAVSNRAVGGPLDVFEISPARGVLPGEGAEKFDIRFNPANLASSSMRAVMMVKSAPLAALPGPLQKSSLQRLHKEGHGASPKARSWLEEMGTPAMVEEYVKKSGAISTSKNLINLQTLVHLVVNQVMNDEAAEVDDYEFRRMSLWVRQLLQHVDSVRNAGQTVIVDDNSSVDNDAASVTSTVAGSIDGVTLYLQLFDWASTGEEEDPDAALPQPVAPLRVSRNVDPIPELVSDSGNDAHLEEVHPPLPTLREFHPSERSMMAEVWLDVDNAVVLLGDAVCAVLDSKVMHEAVDYLKECALNNLAALQIAVYGEGRSQALHVTPPVQEFGGLLSLGKAVSGTFTVVNPSSTTAEIEIDMKSMKVETLFSSSANEGFEETLSQANILDQSELILFVPEYERVLVMPQSEVTVHYTMSIFNTGRYRVFLPLVPKSPYTTVDNVVIHASIAGARLRFHAAEIDIGLVGVGSEGNKVITFTNEGDVPAMFMMKPQLHVDINAGGKAGNDLSSQSQGLSQRDNKNISRQNTQRDSLSRMSSARSDDFSVGGESNATSTDFKIELKNAVVTIEPPSGVVPPQGTFSVNVVCKAGKIPQRIRGLIESRVFDVTGKIEILSQYLNLRGEVQAPKTKMYPLTTSLGQVYVGMPVQFTISVENMCNLPTMYKLARPGGDSSLYKLTYDKPKGPLDAKQKVDILCTFTAIATGMIDDIISNKVFGAAIPLAFVVKALSKGILLEFRPLPEDASPPPPLAAPTETQFPGNQKPPDPQPIQPLVIGSDVPLYQRRTVRFVVRNFSAIPAPFKLYAKTFKVVEKVKRWASSNESATSAATALTAERKDLILAPHEGGTNRFQSEAGKEYIGFTVQKQEDRKFLQSGLGASYLLDVTEGVLPPWGVQLVTVRAFNDIPGCYDDTIECEVTEGTVTHTYSIPISMSVVGCPIVIEKDTLGMTVVHKGDASILGKQMLQLGYACVNSEPLVREFYVKNHGSKNGKVKWQVKSLTSKSNGPVKFSLRVDERLRVHPVFQFWEDIAKDSPFKIEPDSATIPPYGKQLFKVTLFRTNQLGKELAMLTGSVLFSDIVASADSVGGEDDMTVGSAEPPAPAAAVVPPRPPMSRQMSASTSKVLNSAGTGNNKFTLNLILEGMFQYPTVSIDRNVFEASASPTIASDLCALNMKAAATMLFAKGAKASDFCHKAITITNPSDARLLFNVSTEGPYTIKDAAGASSGASSMAGGGVPGGSVVQSVVSQAGGSIVSVARSTVGKTFNLLPNESGTFHIAFNPKRDLREKLLGTFKSEAGNPTEQSGKLIFSYATGQSLHVPIITKISTPFLAASSPRMYFGVCHTTQNCEGILLLSNPTSVPAHWTVAHVPGEGAWRRSTAIRVRGFSEAAPEEDDPSVFEISPDAGLVLGPTVSVTAAVAAPPRDYNRRVDTIVPERVVKASWATNTLSLKDSLELRHHDQHESEADACYPMPLNVRFRPKKNAHYSSRFRFTCEFANSFDLVLQGEGTYEEHLHKPINPTPK